MQPILSKSEHLKTCAKGRVHTWPLTLGGALFGLGSAQLQAGGAIGAGALTFGKDVGLQAGTTLGAGAIQSAGKVSASAAGDVALTSVTAVGDLSVTSNGGNVGASGSLTSGGATHVEANGNVAVSGGVSSSGTIAIKADTGNVSLGGLTSNAGATVQAAQQLTLSGTSQTVGDLSLTGDGVSVSGSVTTSGSLTIGATHTLDGSGARLVASHDVHLSGQEVKLGNTLAGGALDAQAGDQLTLAAGTVGVVGAASLTGGNGMTNAANVLSGGALTVSAPQLINQAGASLASTGATTITVTNFSNAGLVNGGTTTVNAANWVGNGGGALMGVNALTLSTTLFDNRNGVLFAGNASDPASQTGDLSLTIRGGNGSLNNADGKLLAQHNLSLNLSNMAFDPTQGTINQGGGLYITAGTINVGSNWNYGGQSVTLNGLNGITNVGVMSGTAALTMYAGGGVSNYGQVLGSNVTLNTSLANYANAIVHADGTLTLNGDTYNRGTVEAGGTLNVNGGTYDNQGGLTQSRGDANFNLGGGVLQNTGGQIYVGNNLTVNAGTVVNDQTAPGGAVTTSYATVDPNLLWSGSIGTSEVKWAYFYGGDHFKADGAFYTAQQAATVGQLLAPTGVTPSTVNTSQVSNVFGYRSCFGGCSMETSQPITGSGTVTFYQEQVFTTVGGDHSHTVMQPVWILDSGAVPVGAPTVTLALPTATVTTTTQQAGTSGVISAGGSVALTAGTLSNRGGKISAAGNVTLNVQNLGNGAVAPTLTNQTVTAYDAGQYAAFLSQLKSMGMILATGNATNSTSRFCMNSDNCPTNAVATQLFNINTSSAAPVSYGSVSSSTPTGMIAAGGNLTLLGGNLVNAGLLYAGNNVLIGAQSFSNQGGNQQNYSSQVGCASGVPNSACGNAGQPRGNNPNTTSFGYSQSDATIYAGHDLVVAAGSIDNTYGNLLAGHDIVMGGVGSTASSTTPAASLTNTSGNIIAGNNITLNVSGAITNTLPPPVPVHENYGTQEQYAGCMTAGGYKESYCEGYVDQQSGSSSVISAGNKLGINAGSLANIGSLIAAGNDATIAVAGPVVNEAQTLNAYWHSHWVQETGMFSSDKRHDIWACGSVAECTALYGRAYTNSGGQIDPPTPVGNIAATIQAPNLSITSGGQIQNVGNVIGTAVSLTGQKLINGITRPNTYTPTVSAPQRVITLSPATLPGLNLSIPRTIGTGSIPTPVAGTASYVDGSLGSSGIGNLGPQNLLSNLPATLQPSAALFYYNPQEEDRKRSIRHTLTVGPKLCARSIKAAAV
ncbi:hypothetical protein EFP20_18085 [Burkholderia glumae]|nr:hypothetical protein EFP20_18085 [Burkholderia glumae]